MSREDKVLLGSVLLIAYGFPPVGGSTAIRVLKFCKYLVRFRWKPIVLTVNKPRVFEFDPSLLGELPAEVEVSRTLSLELPNFLYKKWTADDEKSAIATIPGLKSVLSMALKRVRYFLFIVDERIGWVPFAVIRGLGLIRKRQIKVIYVAVKPFSSLIAAVLLKKITGLPLVVDFHDAWVSFNRYFWSDKPVFFRKFEKLIEKIAVQNADKIISVNEKIIDDFRLRYFCMPEEKFSVLYNGYDPEDFSEPADRVSDGRFTITYAGSLYAKRSPENFFRVLKMLIEEDPRLKEKIHFLYIGKSFTLNRGFTLPGILGDVVESVGMLSHKECIRKIRKSDILLFIEDQVEISDWLLPTKIFEYLAAQRPILALAKKGPAADLINDSDSGIVLDNCEIELIRNALLSLINGELKFTFGSGSRKIAIERYSQENSSAVLAHIFKGLI